MTIFLVCFTERRRSAPSFRSRGAQGCDSGTSTCRALVGGSA